MGGTTRFLMLITTTTSSPFLHHHQRFPSLLRFSRHRRQLLPSSLSSFPHHLHLHHHHHHTSSLPLPFKVKASQHQLHTQTTAALPRATTAHPWPEWSNFINNLTFAGYFNRKIEISDEFMDGVNLPDHFISAASACFAFARERPELLGMLSRRDIEMVADKGVPFLFKNGDDSKRKMMSFLGGNVQNADIAHTVDLVRFLLSYASILVSSEKKNLPSGDMESSIRHLLSELAQLTYTPQQTLSGSVQNQLPDRYGRAPRPLGQNVEMKRGDWICPRCSFMNFARNMKCLECEEARPKRQLTGGEWECPQCDFFNYGRNMVCLRCDCKRPGELTLSTTNSRSGLGYENGNNANKADVESRLAINEEKAKRWFSKMSQMDNNSDMSSSIADEDFPEIMPLRKGVNRFVVSTRKTPLERRLGNAGNGGTPESPGSNSHSSMSDSNSPKFSAPGGSNYVPFVPLPADMFAKKPETSQMAKSELQMDSKSPASSSDEQTVPGSDEFIKSSDSGNSSERLMGDTLSNQEEKEQAEKSERWFNRVAELHSVTDLASAISDEDFPEIMPMRKGENRFVVSKRKDRSLTSPMYKRRMAMEQANNTNFVPFVPFPPNHFAQKDNQQSGGADSTRNSTSGDSNSAALEELPEKLDDSKPGVPVGAHIKGIENQQFRSGSMDPRSWENSNESKADASHGAQTSGNLTQNIVDPQPNRKNNWSSECSGNASVTSNLVGSSAQNYTNSPTIGNDSRDNVFSRKEDVNEAANLKGTTVSSSENQNIRDSWSGKSLEGSAVKEPDPLDMSEEAKAERWFRRVAQIKDISELSQIPDEDFPSIMPMRKGVNRFVVSKRKTPLERRLTSTQYRRNLPTVSSEPVKESDNN